jgi:hypothetical protein
VIFVHVGGFNLGLLMRTLVRVGTPSGLQGRITALVASVLAVWTDLATRRSDSHDHGGGFMPHPRLDLLSAAGWNTSINHGLLTPPHTHHRQPFGAPHRPTMSTIGSMDEK